ncbi:MAG: SH3 domain-containing protein [Spirochaetaceae bacterium]|nr:SH3 domain-containing protein [Spirochaetaceae bacterium]
MKALILKTLLISIILLFSSSCSRGGTGFFVAIWPPEESSLRSGDIVRVVSQSEIRNLFVIENEGRIREEIPRYTGRFFTRRRDAEQFLLQYEPYVDMFAYSEVSLNIRTSPTSSAAREYRLRPGQVVKVISKLPEPYTVGNLTGNWIEVLTETGFSGFCFDRHLSFFERDSAVSTADYEEKFLDSFFTNRWYPSAYLDIINSGRIAIERLRTGEGLFPDKNNRRIVIQTERDRIEFSFTNIFFSGNSAIFMGSPVEVIFYSTERIYVKYTHRGVDHLSFFTTLEMPVEHYVQEEIGRRNDAMDLFFRRGRHLVSDLYGSITLGDRRGFTWTGYVNLVPDVIPLASGSLGVVRDNHFLGRHLERRFDGVLAFEFDATRRAAVFAYVFVDGGIRFTHVSARNIENNIITSVPADSHILYFRQSLLPHEGDQ